jgi:rfaE bifunctional protein kinase chain/domain/rfaE bifunctional protein nucleotidyltransferase chain/domain
MNESCTRKIVSRQELIEATRAAQAGGQTVVHCHGCFDIVHPGHVRYLEFAHRQGDLLVVSLTGDSQISKGDQRPYIPEELRAENIAALEVVDLVYVNPDPTASDLINDLRPDIYVKGHEYAHSADPGFLAERRVVESYGGRVLFSSGDIIFSSSRLIENLAHNPVLETERLGIICRRYGIDRTSTEALLRSFAGLNVLVVGDLILDRYAFCDATDLASESPMMSLARLEERVYVGGAGIVARHAAGLGANTYLLSTAAHDKQSSLAQATLAHEGVNTHLIACRPRLPEKTRYLVDTTKLFRVEDAEIHPLDSVSERQAAVWIESIADRIDVVIFCDFGYGTVTRGLLARLREILDSRPRVLAAEVSGPRGLLLDFKNATILCPSERELRSALHDFQSGLSNAAWNVMNQTQARHMLVTLGKKGVVVFDRQSHDINDPEWQGRLRSEYLPSLADHVVDSLGCGDALLTTTTLTLAAGGRLMQAAYLGSAAAAIEITRVGNMPLDSDSLRRWLGGRIEMVRSHAAEADGGLRAPAQESGVLRATRAAT